MTNEKGVVERFRELTLENQDHLLVLSRAIYAVEHTVRQYEPVSEGAKEGRNRAEKRRSAG
ncbi:MAG: hypothetical protein LBT13_04215 [Treponema sp.]|jgi:hypothetical protein|nr:hypothetical protein [Treponema sp.]